MFGSDNRIHCEVSKDDRGFTVQKQWKEMVEILLRDG